MTPNNAVQEMGATSDAFQPDLLTSGRRWRRLRRKLSGHLLAINFQSLLGPLTLTLGFQMNKYCDNFVRVIININATITNC